VKLKRLNTRTKELYLIAIGFFRVSKSHFIRTLTKPLETKEKRRIYQADILYTTNSALGFDYLIENLAENKKNQFLREFNYVIIDEIMS